MSWVTILQFLTALFEFFAAIMGVLGAFVGLAAAKIQYRMLFYSRAEQPDARSQPLSILAEAALAALVLAAIDILEQETDGTDKLQVDRA